jgi:hypothetical protein
LEFFRNKLPGKVELLGHFLELLVVLFRPVGAILLVFIRYGAIRPVERRPIWRS